MTFFIAIVCIIEDFWNGNRMSFRRLKILIIIKWVILDKTISVWVNIVNYYSSQSLIVTVRWTQYAFTKIKKKIYTIKFLIMTRKEQLTMKKLVWKMTLLKWKMYCKKIKRNYFVFRWFWLNKSTWHTWSWCYSHKIF